MSTHSDRNVPARDLLLLDRFLDGALSADELAVCRRRLEAEPALRQALQQRTRLRAGFDAGREQVFAPRAGFAEGVVAAARRLPVAGDEVAAVGAAVRTCRRMLLVAAAVAAAAVLWQSGLFRDRGDGTLRAAPDEASRILDALDAEVRAGAVDRRK